MSAQHLPRVTYILREMLCGHSADIYLQGYMSAQCPHYILLRFSAQGAPISCQRRTTSLGHSIWVKNHFANLCISFYELRVENKNSAALKKCPNDGILQPTFDI